ncbi:Chloride channel-c [Carabus blaptoides fortunei]
MEDYIIIQNYKVENHVCNIMFSATVAVEESDDMPGIGQYDDFHTIARDRMRHRYIIKKKQDSLWNLIKGGHDAWSGWLDGRPQVRDMSASVLTQPGAVLLVVQCNEFRFGQLFTGNLDIPLPRWFTWPEVFGQSREGAGPYIISYLLYIMWGLLFAALSASLVRMFAPYACGSVRRPDSVRVRGTHLGKEGPIAHIACCIGNILSYLLPKYGRNEAKKREILSAATAVGVSVAFGAPIGRVLASLEEVSYYFPLKTLWRSFFCAIHPALHQSLRQRTLCFIPRGIQQTLDILRASSVRRAENHWGTMVSSELCALITQCFLRN